MAHFDSMFAGALLISGRNWLPAALGLLLVAMVALFWGYRRAPASPWVHAGCVFLKLLGLLALFFCLLEPLWTGQRARPGANFIAVLADNSQGMRIKDSGQAHSRGEFLRDLLTTDKTTWQGKLEENFQTRRYLFDSKLQFTKTFSTLDFDGRSSAIGGALRALTERYRGQPLAGILMFTDGNATDLAEGTAQLSGVPPIYPVVIGSDAPIKDIALQKVTVTQTAFEDAPVSIQADVTAVGFDGRQIVAQLIDLSPGLRTETSDVPSLATNAHSAEARNPRKSGTNAPKLAPASAGGEELVGQERKVTELTQRAPKEGETMAFRFQVRPDKSGISFYRVRLSSKSEVGQGAEPENSTEATLANNSRIIAVDRGKGPYRVLYVAGRPNWEYKFLHRAIEEDDQVQLSALIRIARREPKMEFRGRAGESSNPLFRGFGNQSREEAERYDQPVFRPLAQDEEEFARLRGGFPKTAEDLYRYQAVILDDLEAEFFTHDQMALLQKFVSERGGGFLMLGGQESFHEGQFERTPIGEMLPVYLDRTTERSPAGGYHINLTREGWLQPWARLRNNEAEEKTRLGEMAPFLVLNHVREFKPGASVIATAADAAGKTYPALVVQRFGNGRTAALMIGDLWHWGLRDKESHKDMDKAWRQMLRWLVADVPNRIEVLAEQNPSDPNQAVLLQVRARDEKFQPLDNAAATVLVRPVGQSTPAQTGSADPLNPPAGSGALPQAGARLTPEPASTEPGLYQATYIPRQTGGYLAEAVVTNAVGAEVGRAQVGWSSDPAADEFKSLKPNRALLEELAKRTGGEVLTADRLDSFVSSLPQRKVPIAEDWSYPLWHQPVVFLLALGCFVAEWGLRRWKGLA